MSVAQPPAPFTLSFLSAVVLVFLSVIPSGNLLLSFPPPYYPLTEAWITGVAPTPLFTSGFFATNPTSASASCSSISAAC